MSFTPKSDKSQTRFSTPVSDLDDHRRQPASLPRVEAGASKPGTRRGTFTSIHPVADRPDLLRVNDALAVNDVQSRDFEHAIVDDESPLQEAAGHQRARRNTFRRHRDAPLDASPRSRPNSVSTRSVSPPNSVDAFAGPRRRERAGTIASKSPSDLDIPLHRTASGGTHKRRPTLCEDGPLDLATDAASRHSSAEEDVCFPVQDDAGKSSQIDFEELEEFVATFPEKTPILPALRRKTSAGSHVQHPRVFHDLRPKTSTPTTAVPGDALHMAEPSSAVLAEKLADADSSQAAIQEPKADAPDTVLNRWTFFSSELDDTVHAAELRGLLMPGESFRDLFELSPEGGVWWLDMINPTEEEVFAVCKAFGVHPLTREDITTQETREKVELFRSYYFVSFRSFYQMDKTSEYYLEPVNYYAVVFREGLLTFAFCESPHAANVRKRIGRLRDYVSLSSDWVCYAIM